MENTKNIWRERLARLARTNSSIEEFATQEGVAVSSLRWWRWRLSSEAKRKRAYAPLARAAGITGPPFVEVGSPEPKTPSAATGFEVLLVNGRVVRVPASFDDGVLGRLLAVAEGAR